MVACVLHPRFELLVALRERRPLLSEPAALAPEAGAEQVVGEVSAAAEAFGVVPRMRVGEALARCPGLRLVPPDPEGVRRSWNRVLDRLEGIGAEVESERPGVAFFEAGGLEGIHGGCDGVLLTVCRELGPGIRVAAGPSRFVAQVAAIHARPPRRRARGRLHTIIRDDSAAGFLAPLPVELLRARPELQRLPEVLTRLGFRTLGEVAALPRWAVAERFGHPGLRALDLAGGRDSPLEPRRPPEPVTERLELPEATSGAQLERALDLLVARMLARRERRGRSLRRLALSARFVAGGTWRRAATLRQASADPASIRLALAAKLGELPAPAESLSLEVEAYGPPAREQQSLLDSAGDARRARLGEAIRQVRAAAGEESALRVLEVDPDSRIPERRTMLAPFPDGGAP